MAELVVQGSDNTWTQRQLVLRLSWWEKIVAMHGNVRAPLSSVEYVHVYARPADVRKVRKQQFRLESGTGAFIDLGYGVRGYGKNFVAVRRQRPAVLVRLHPPSRFGGLLVTVADPETTAKRIMDAKHAPRNRREA